MEEKKWMLLSNHGRVFAYIARHPENTVQVMAQELALSIRAVQQIIDDLERKAYLHRQKVGRCNHYIIHPEALEHHRMTVDSAVVDLLVNRPIPK